MKKFKSLLLFSFILASLTVVVSCKKEHDPKEDAEEQNDAVIEDRDTEKDADFLVAAADINMAEVKLGQLAQQKATTKEAKDLGKMMETAHSKAMEELTALAAQKNITLPTGPSEKSTDEFNKLNENSGMDFDKEYCEMMVKGHKDAIDKFEKASADSEDADIKAWATKMLPDLKMHLEHSEMCKKVCDDKK
ncbi:MAG: DUF4142 domain-containing protein [Bacteroidota bacterium]